MKSASLISLLLGPLLLVGPRAAVAQQGALPWHAPDGPPIVAGLRLEASRAASDALLGPPDSVVHFGSGGNRLLFRSRGISLLYPAGDSLMGLYLDARQAGDIGGVRVGDTRDAVLTRWGSPNRDEAELAIWMVGRWAIIVQFDAKLQRVAGLGLRMLPAGQ